MIQRAYYFVASRVRGTGVLREGPGTGYRVVGEIREGERFLIVNSVKPAGAASWYKLRLDSGAEAWVSGTLGDEVQE